MALTVLPFSEGFGLFLVGKIANPALSFVRLLASAICNQGPTEGPKMWLGFVLIGYGNTGCVVFKLGYKS